MTSRTYKILADNLSVFEFEGPKNMNDIQRRIIIEGFAQDRKVSTKGMSIVSSRYDTFQEKG